VIHGDGEQARDFTFVDDVVRANLLAAEAPEPA
jgi:nucleoside-diphosphate-sugar epimerase